MLSLETEIGQRLVEFFGLVNYFSINLVMCVMNVVLIIAGLTGVPKVLA